MSTRLVDKHPARWLLSQGFEPTIFEQAPMLGGQWTGLPGHSGVWPTMHTNTSRVPTIFGDLEHDTDRVYPSRRDILAYLHRYADKFDLVSCVRFGTRVDLLSRNDTGWVVGHFGAITSNGLTEREQRYWSLVTDAHQPS